MNKSIIAVASTTLLLGSIAGGCKANKADRVSVSDTTGVIMAGEIVEAPAEPLENSEAMIPKAVIYKTNGDYAANVAVTLSPDRRSVVSYPDPSDVGKRSIPAAIADGWLLDRRGAASGATGFLDWTYEEYAALPAVPSRAELMQHVIPDARIVSVRTLSITAHDAATQIERLQDPAYLKSVLGKGNPAPEAIDEAIDADE